MYKVIIYGIGAGGGENLKIIRQRLSDRFEVIGYMDSYYQKRYYQYQKVFCIDELPQTDYDYIIINTRSQSSDEEIYNLLCNHGVKTEKIVRYAKYVFSHPMFPFQYTVNTYDVFQNLKNPPRFEGILIGMSYAEVGIDVNYLSGYVYNFAHGSFDLFYRKLLIEKVCDKIGLEDLRYIILELPYYIFNLDLSLCDNGLFQRCMAYLSYWQNWHHFDEKEENREFLKGFPIFQDMFLKDSLGNYSMVENRRIMSNRQITEEDIKKHVIAHMIEKYYEKTVEENKHIFYEILKMIHEKLPAIKIVILVCPQPSVIRMLYRKYPIQKKIFGEQMELAQTRYP